MESDEHDNYIQSLQKIVYNTWANDYRYRSAYYQVTNAIIGAFEPFEFVGVLSIDTNLVSDIYNAKTSIISNACATRTSYYVKERRVPCVIAFEHHIANYIKAKDLEKFNRYTFSATNMAELICLNPGMSPRAGLNYLDALLYAHRSGAIDTLWQTNDLQHVSPAYKMEVTDPVMVLTQHYWTNVWDRTAREAFVRPLWFSKLNVEV